jgi:hypothetical protein
VWLMRDALKSVARHGEPDRLPLDQARLLLGSLASLESEDPYFRSEDWGRRTISGLARPELKDDVVALIMRPDRHVHLTTLILEALEGSPLLTKIIAQELLTIVKNSDAAYVERNHAVEALTRSDVDIDWPAVAESFQTRGATGDKRLTLEIVALARGAGFDGQQIAGAILDYTKPSRFSPEEDGSDDDTDDDPYVSGMVYGITQNISSKLAGAVLDGIASDIQSSNKPVHWRPGYELSSSIPDEIRPALSLGTERHPVLVQHWKELTAPPKRDWRKEEQDRKFHYEQERARKFEGHRAAFWPLKEKIASGQEIGALSQFAKAYLGGYIDLDRDSSPDARLREWLGDELANTALTGFVSALARDDAPSAAQIAETHVQGNYRHFELVLICGIAELVRLGHPLNSISKGVASATLAAWWNAPDANSDRLGEGVRDELEDIVFSSDQSIDDFLSSVAEPHVREGHQHVPGLYRIAREDRFKSVVGKISLRWLRAYPHANAPVQFELLQMAIEHGLTADVRVLVRERLSNLHDADILLQRIWMSATFLLNFQESKETFSVFFSNDKNHLWTLGELIRRDRHEWRTTNPIDVFVLDVSKPKCS